MQSVIIIFMNIRGLVHCQTSYFHAFRPGHIRPDYRKNPNTCNSFAGWFGFQELREVA